MVIHQIIEVLFYQWPHAFISQMWQWTEVDGEDELWRSLLLLAHSKWQGRTINLKILAKRNRKTHKGSRFLSLLHTVSVQSMHVINQTQQSGWPLFFSPPPLSFLGAALMSRYTSKALFKCESIYPFFFSLWCFMYTITKELLGFMRRFPPFMWKGSSELLQLFWNRLEGSEKKVHVARGARKGEGKKSKDITESWLITQREH